MSCIENKRLIFFIYLLKYTHTHMEQKTEVRVELKDQYKYIFIMDGSESNKIWEEVGGDGRIKEG